MMFLRRLSPLRALALQTIAFPHPTSRLRRLTKVFLITMIVMMLFVIYINVNFTLSICASIVRLAIGFIYPALVYFCDHDNSQKSFKHTLAQVYLICQLAVMLFSAAAAVELERSSLRVPYREVTLTVVFHVVRRARNANTSATVHAFAHEPVNATMSVLRLNSSGITD